MYVLFSADVTSLDTLHLNTPNDLSQSERYKINPSIITTVQKYSSTMHTLYELENLHSYRNATIAEGIL
jgi:hypothetical protein